MKIGGQAQRPPIGWRESRGEVWTHETGRVGHRRQLSRRGRSPPGAHATAARGGVGAGERSRGRDAGHRPRNGRLAHGNRQAVVAGERGAAYVAATSEPQRSHVEATSAQVIRAQGPVGAFRPSIRPSVRVIIDSVSGFFQCFPPRKLEGQSLTRSDQTDRAPLSRRSSTRDERAPAA